MLSPRFLYTDYPQTIAGDGKAPEIMQPNFALANKAGQQSQAYLDQTFDYVQKSTAQNAELTGRAYNNVADAAKAYVVANATTESAQGGFNNLAGAISNLAQGYLKFKQGLSEADEAAYRREQAALDRQFKIEDQDMQRQRFGLELQDREDAKAAAIRKQDAAVNWLLANDEAEKLLTSAPEIISGEGGLTAYGERRVELISKYIQSIEPDKAIELIKKLSDPEQAETKRQADEKRKFGDDLRTARSNTEISKGLLFLSGQTAAIKASIDPAELQTNLNKYLATVREYAAKLDPLTQENFLTRALTDADGALDLRQGQFLELKNGLTNLIAFNREVIGESQKLKQGGAKYLPQYNANVGYLKKKYGITGATAADDPFAVDKREAELRSRQESVDESVKKNEMTAIERTRVTQDEVVAFAVSFYNDPRQREAFSKYLKNPQIKSAITLAEDIEKYDKLVKDTQDKKQRFREELVRLDASDIKQQLAWIGSDAGEDTLKSLGIMARLNPQLEALAKEQERLVKKDPLILEKLQSQIEGRDTTALTLGNLAGIDPQGGLTQIGGRLSSDVTPEEIQGLRQRVFTINNIVKQEIQKQSAATDKDPELIRLRGRLQAYKLLAPNQREAQAKVATGRVQQVLSRIEKLKAQENTRTLQPQMRSGGTQPEYPFKLPQLKRLSMRGQEIITPFLPGADVSFTDDYKAPRPGRLHAGVDIGAANGTKLVFYDQGVVDYVGVQPGYGKMVDIKTPDGKLHRFAHLSNYDVSVGQKVNPGQKFANTGDTGSPGSYHLHWEVRNTATGGFGGSIDPVRHMTQYRQGTGRQVRNGQPNPTGVPLESVRMRNGEYVQSGQLVRRDGSATPIAYSASNPMRPDYASPNVASYQRRNRAYDNYGYAELGKDKKFAQEIAKTASHIGVPAQWLADLMAGESGFSKDVVNPASGSTGLIQFMPDTARSLGTSVEALSNMNRIEQMKYVRKYFDVNGFSKNMKNVYALVTAVWAGHIDRANRLDPSLKPLSDGSVNFVQYIRGLGRNAGRQYTPYGETHQERPRFVPPPAIATKPTQARSTGYVKYSKTPLPGSSRTAPPARPSTRPPSKFSPIAKPKAGTVYPNYGVGKSKPTETLADYAPGGRFYKPGTLTEKQEANYREQQKQLKQSSTTKTPGKVQQGKVLHTSYRGTCSVCNSIERSDTAFFTHEVSSGYS